MRAAVLAFGLFCLATPAFCQRPPAPYYEDTNNIPVPHGTVHVNFYDSTYLEMSRMF